MNGKSISLVCDFCKKSFSDEAKLSLHVMSIHKSITEGQKSHLVKILNTKTGQKKNFQCKQCDKTYSQSYHLLRHIRTCHETTYLIAINVENNSNVLMV